MKHLKAFKTRNDWGKIRETLARPNISLIEDEGKTVAISIYATLEPWEDGGNIDVSGE